MGLLPQTVKKALRRSLPSAGGKYNPIVFPAACTWEKHFARSERRIVRPRAHNRGAERSETLLKKDAKHLF